MIDIGDIIGVLVGWLLARASGVVDNLRQRRSALRFAESIVQDINVSFDAFEAFHKEGMPNTGIGVLTGQDPDWAASIPPSSPELPMFFEDAILDLYRSNPTDEGASIANGMRHLRSALEALKDRHTAVRSALEHELPAERLLASYDVARKMYKDSAVELWVKAMRERDAGLITYAGRWIKRKANAIAARTP